jgi:tricorn protease
MARHLTLVATLALALVWPASGSRPAAQSGTPQIAPQTGPIKFARFPDYHAGRIAFTYMGDIWVAAEDGSNPVRLTVNTARDVYPRFSPDGRWIAFSSNRFGNNDVFVVSASGGAPRQLTFFSGGDDVVGWSRDGQNVLFRSAHGDGAFPNVATLYQVAVTGGPEKPLPVDWGYYGDFSPDGRLLVFNRRPASWTRKHYRGSYTADLWIADLAQKTYRQLLDSEQYNRFWPMWGADNNIYYVADPLPNEKSVKAGSLDVFKSANNIYRIPASGGGQAVQITKHTSGSLFWPSMSGDGKTIVYEENFGIWKLDVASGRTTEIKIDIATDDKENEYEVVTLQNEVDAFDLSPSGQRAVISARGQILTIATNRGDITRIAPDPMATRNQSPKWSPDGKFVAYLSDKSGRDEIWLTDPDGRSPKQITNLDFEKGGMQWTPDSKALVYGAADKKLYSYSVADAKTGVITSDTIARFVGNFSISPDSKWVAFSKPDRTLRQHVYITPIGGGEERHVSDDRVHYSEANPVWTADGRYLVFTSSEGFSNGIATQGGITTTTELWAVPLRDQDRDPLNRDIDNEAQALAAQAAGGGRGGGGGGPATPVTVTIDWNNIARRARQIPVPGDAISGLVASPTGASIAFTLGSAGGGAAAAATAGIYIVNVDTNALTRMPAAGTGDGGGRGGGRGGGGGGGGGGGMVFTRDGRTLYFRSGTGLYSAAVPTGGGTTPAGAPAGGGGGRGGGRGGGGGAAAAAPEASGTARLVTYCARRSSMKAGAS